MTVEMSQRLARAFSFGASLEERDLIIAAAEGASSFDEMPADVRQLVLTLEARASTFR